MVICIVGSIAAVPVVLVGWFVRDYLSAPPPPMTLEHAETVEDYLGLISDPGLDYKTGWVAAYRLEEMTRDDPAVRAEIVARLVDLRDGAGDDGFRRGIRQHISYFHEDALLAALDGMSARFVPLVGHSFNDWQAILSSEDVPRLHDAVDVDEIIDLVSDSGGVEFRYKSISLAAREYSRLPLFGLTEGEFQRRIESLKSVGLVLRSYRTVGTVTGDCSGRLLRQTAWLFLIDAERGRVAGAAAKSGNAPTGRMQVSAFARDCDIRGSSVDESAFFRVAD